MPLAQLLHLYRFSPLGVAYLCLLFIPNILWARRQRASPKVAAARESPVLALFERVGQAMTTMAAVVEPAARHAGPARVMCLMCLMVSIVAIALYEVAWLQYFRAPIGSASIYSKLGPIPQPLAILPVLGFSLLALYQEHWVLVVSVLTLGVGHIGIHVVHARELRGQ